MLGRLVIGIATLAVLAAEVGVFHLWRLDVRGRAAVTQMCAVDGGPTVTQTISVPGFLDDTIETDQCILCQTVVGKGVFTFVDYEVKRPTLYLDEAGYYRLSLSQLGDSRCERYSRASYPKTPADFGRDPSLCFAIERLAGRPAGYVYARGFRRAPAPNGYVLGVVETFIRHEPSGAVLAVNRDYLYTSVVSRYAAGGGVTDATCPAAFSWRFDSEAMIKAVLSAEDQQ